MKRASYDDAALDAVQRWARVFRELPIDDRAPAILKFCQYALDYVRDPKREVLEDSAVTLNRGFGDCDAKSRVFIALCIACGIPARSFPVRPEADFPHVLAEVFWRGAWLRADPTILNSEIGFSAGCQRIRSLYRDEEVRANAYLLVDGTHASLPPEPSEIAWLQQLAADARAGQSLLVASHTLQTYVEELPPNERFASTIRVLRLATGFPLAQAGPLEAPRITQSGSLWVYSYASQNFDAKAHVDQHEWALPALAAAHMAPALTGQVYVPAETKGSGGGLGLALLAAGVVWAVG